MSMAVSVAGFMAFQGETDIRRLESARLKAQADLNAESAVKWAGEYILEQVLRKRTGVGENEPETVPVFTPENGSVNLAVSDAQGRFNLNNILRDGVPSKRDIEAFKRLLDILDLPAELADAVLDWIDRDSEPRSGGAEDSFYLSGYPPRLAANRPMQEVDELIWVKGFNEKIVEALRPYITALPDETRINVNSAPAETLMAMIDGITLAEANGVIAARKYSRFTNMADFRKSLPARIASVNEMNFTVTGGYFSVYVESKQGRARSSLVALLAVDDETRRARLIWRKEL